MSQPDINENDDPYGWRMCQWCDHPYLVDDLSDEQAAQDNPCPYCNPNTQGDSLRLRGRAIKM